MSSLGRWESRWAWVAGKRAGRRKEKEEGKGLKLAPDLKQLNSKASFKRANFSLYSLFSLLILLLLLLLLEALEFN